MRCVYCYHLFYCYYSAWYVLRCLLHSIELFFTATFVVYCKCVLVLYLILLLNVYNMLVLMHMFIHYSALCDKILFSWYRMYHTLTSQ